MNRSELEHKKSELKSDYVRIQADLEKLGSVGGNPANGEKVLKRIEEELSEVNKQLSQLDD
ncbi:SE1832 family protein [Aquibacillus koreensis]|uniref:SE1832 family protein n=1 Tax=Aquibacillus koreensis TaxID=279446 RepID=A0A9X3WLI5_9BACI|nr:SE1832 family protein [Aquibacillus koreensis]MCT2538243.1 SE1832 family protein [Aquibacillus koreensis]MDC3420813.1 SE1832 family protein [Aquibacillus koreensis]